MYKESANMNRESNMNGVTKTIEDGVFLYQIIIKDYYKKKNPKKIMEMDGVSIEFDDYWFNVRPSNTEPLLRLNLEAVSKKVMEEKKDEVSGLM